MTSLVEEAKRLCDRGFFIIPIPHRSKNPNRAGWQNERHGLDELEDLFTDECNIGVLLGEPSGGLVDVDLDAQEAIRCAPFFLPSTGWKHGRESKPSSHWFYLCGDPPRTRRFADVDGTVLVELRGTGGQTIVPPSAHPSGEAVVYYSDGEASRIDIKKISEAVAHLACASMLARHWPAEGSRHQASLAIAGFLIRRGVGAGLCARIVERAAMAAGDTESRDRANAVMDTADRLNRGEQVTGGPTASEIVDPRVLAKLEAWLSLGSGFGGRGSVGASDFQSLTPVPSPLSPVPLADLQRRAKGEGEGEFDFLPVLGQRPPLFVRGWTHMLIAYPKTGKSELMTRAVADWSSLGMKVAYFTEEPESLWMQRTARMPDGFDNVRMAFTLSYSREQIMDCITRSEADVVVVDTMRLLGIEDENNNAQIHRWLAPIIALCRQREITLVLVHHTRKGGGQHGEAASGGHAFLGIVDVALELHRTPNTPNRRVIKGLGRIIEIPELVYELREDGTMEILGEASEFEAEKVKARVLKALTDEWMTAREIRETIDNPKPSIKHLRQMLASLAEEGFVERQPPFDDGMRAGVTYRWRFAGESEFLG